GSMAMDKIGNIALGYNISSRTLHAGIRYTSRAPNDPLGTLGSEVILQSGTGTQRCRLANGACDPFCQLPGGQCDSLNRWGDYSSITIDPTDDCTFWYTTEYLKSPDGAFRWHTRIGSFKI